LGLRLGTSPKTYGESVGSAVRMIQAAKEGEANPELVNTLNSIFEQVASAQEINPSAGNALLPRIPYVR
ncbi:hypothetical protein, partial [Klebsiella pneumoniae]|uniref:hypothetical protein n=1 Tax=Klebsiella pneumoniae TaxID=573 RepID=UPI0039688C43